MNNGHLPAGRAAHSGGAGPGLADGPGERHGGPGNGGGRHEGGGGGGRGGPRRGGRHYNSYYHPHHGPHNMHGHAPHNQHAQFQQQMYPGYMNPYTAQQYGYPPMPYMQNPGMPNAYMYQQPYGRPAAGMPPFAPMMGAPMVGMHPMAPPPAGLQHQPPPPPSGPAAPQQAPQHGLPPAHAPHPQQLPPQMAHLPQSPYSRNVQHTPLVVTTPQAQPMLPPFPGNGLPLQQSPPTGMASFQPIPVPVSMGLPPSLPPHIPIPPHADIIHGNPNIPVPYPVMIPPENPSITPASSISAHAMTTPMSATSLQTDGIATPEAPTGTPSTDAEATPTSETAPVTPPMTNTTTTTETAETTAGTETTEGSDVAEPFVDAQELKSTPRPTKKVTAPSFLDEAPSGNAAPLAQSLDVTKLPWLSRPDAPFPRRKPRGLRRGLGGVQNVELPPSLLEAAAVTIAASAASAAPASQQAAATTPTTAKASVCSPTPADGSAPRPAAPAPALPIIPALPVRPAAGKPSTASAVADAKTDADAEPTAAASAEGKVADAANGEAAEAESLNNAAPSTPLPPKLWTGLFSKAAASAAGGSATATGAAPINGHPANGVNGTVPFLKSNANSLAEAISAYRVESSGKVAFVEPRGLINTGNMCYMNSVLQVLTFCIPFYDFLDQVGQKAAFSFKSETPMIDAMIMFLREFKVIDRAEPIDLQRRLKKEDLDQVGEAFIPEFVYNAINKLPRFSSMIRGHQQDAEEFLGFLLETLNQECARVIQETAITSNPSTTPNSTQETPAESVTSEVPDPAGGGWLEVGPRQRAAVTRSSGHISTSPINSIFGGLLRSELRVPGRKDSVTLEPYQSLQLHIDSPEVRNIIDALRGLTKPEVIHADFKSPTGKDVSATKQVFIEDLPPVLILHLKRFQFDWQGNGTVKIWKKVGYPLDLEIPREIFSRRKRNTFLSEPLPKYRLNAVVYHHGKQASGGHYTVDALREDGREWIRLDDTVIRRIHSDEVAEAGAEETGSGRVDSLNSSIAATPTGKPQAAAGGANRFASMEDDDAAENESGWSAPINGSGKKWSSVANGAVTPATKAKLAKDFTKDKVAYILFYQRIN